MNPTRPALFAVVIFAALALTACGGSTVSSDELSSQVKSALEDSVGAPLEMVDCEEANAEVGETFTCSATEPNGNEIRVKGEITEVDGDNVKFNVEVVS